MLAAVWTVPDIGSLKGFPVRLAARGEPGRRLSGSASPQRGTMSAVPIVFLLHQHGVTMHRHPLPPFSPAVTERSRVQADGTNSPLKRPIAGIPHDEFHGMFCTRCAGKRRQRKTGKINVIRNFGSGEHAGIGAESIRYSRSPSQTGTISSSLTGQSPNFLRRYRNVE